MKQYLHGIFILSLLIGSAGQAATPPFSPYSGQWVLTEQNGKVSVYTQKHQDSDIAVFKAEAVLDQAIANVFAVIADPESCPNWVDGCLLSKAAGGKNFNQRLGYAVNHLPWPFSNRDIVLEIATRGQQHEGSIEVSMQSTESERFPEQEGLVRITESVALYYLEAINEHQTRLIWVQHSDPAGSLPAWLVNAKVIDLPANSIPKLEALAGQERYQGSQLQYDQLGQLNDVILGNGTRVSRLYSISGDKTSRNAMYIRHASDSKVSR